MLGCLDQVVVLSRSEFSHDQVILQAPAGRLHCNLRANETCSSRITIQEEGDVSPQVTVNLVYFASVAERAVHLHLVHELLGTTNWYQIARPSYTQVTGPRINYETFTLAAANQGLASAFTSSVLLASHSQPGAPS